ncbi:sentrin-specific protease 6, partial [Trichonephila clavata]
CRESLKDLLTLPKKGFSSVVASIFGKKLSEPLWKALCCSAAENCNSDYIRKLFKAQVNPRKEKIGIQHLKEISENRINPMPYFGNPMPDLTNWFSEVKITKKRQQLKDLIINIHRKQVSAANANARKSNQPDSIQSSPTVQQTDNR